MKRLMLMRHAKSSWDSGAANDHARPLNNRGRRDAPRVGRALRELGWVPDVVISSDSQRTRETWAGTAPELSDHEIPITFTRDLYHGGLPEIAAVCEELDDRVSCAMLLGHNPGWEDAVSDLSGVRVTMTTGNCALLEADGSWSELMQRRAWTLADLLMPRDLED